MMIRQLILRFGLGLICCAVHFSNASDSLAEENALAKRLVSNALTTQLGRVDSLQRSWEYKSSRRMMAWLDVGVWREQWYWIEATTVNLWIADPQAVDLQFKELHASDDRVAFDVDVSLPLRLHAWHRVCQWIDTDFGAECRATISMRGSFGLEQGKVSEPEFSELSVAVKELTFDRTFCQTFRSPIRGIINSALKRQQARICAALEKELAGRAVY